MKTLETVQKLAKVGKILSKIAFIISIIGAVGTAVGIGGLTVSGGDGLKIGDMPVMDAIENEAGVGVPAMLASMGCGLVFWIAQIFVSKFAANYFSNELADGTPFTTRGADELKRLGIICIAVSLGTAAVCAIGLAIASVVVPSVEAVADDMEGFSSVGIGIAFLVCSVLCRLGAEANGNQSEKTEEPVVTPETAE